jgi:hypothetical protein
MELPETGNRPEQTPAGVQLVATVTHIASRRAMRESPAAQTLRCVSSGYLAAGNSCRTCITTGAVTDAWARERRAGVHGDRFFHFTWRGEVWLAYGLKDGSVRGVYCPEHSADRERRLDGDDSRQAATPARGIALTG